MNAYVSTAELLQLDDIVSSALGRRSRESIYDAAERVMETPRGNRSWRVAREILTTRGTPHSRLRRAAKAARRAGLATIGGP